MGKESKEGQRRHGEVQWQERWKKGVGRGTIWRSKPGTGLSGGQWLRPHAPIGATRLN